MLCKVYSLDFFGGVLPLCFMPGCEAAMRIADAGPGLAILVYGSRAFRLIVFMKIGAPVWR